MSEYDLAVRVDSTEDEIIAYENGSLEPPSEVIEKIAKLFNVSIDELLNENSNNVQYNNYHMQAIAVCDICKKPIFDAREIGREYSTGKVRVHHCICVECNNKKIEEEKENRIQESKSRRIKSFVFGGIILLLGMLLGVSCAVSGEYASCAIYIILGIILYCFISCLILKNNIIPNMFFEIVTFGLEIPFLGIILVLILGIIAIFLCAICSLFVYPLAITTNFKHPEILNNMKK